MHEGNLFWKFYLGQYIATWSSFIPHHLYLFFITFSLAYFKWFKSKCYNPLLLVYAWTGCICFSHTRTFVNSCQFLLLCKNKNQWNCTINSLHYNHLLVCCTSLSWGSCTCMFMPNDIWTLNSLVNTHILLSDRTKYAWARCL